jgi:hypothetical protein
LPSLRINEDRSDISCEARLATSLEPRRSQAVIRSKALTEDLKAALEEAEAELQAAYRKVWPLREAYAEVTPPAALPSRRSRTDKQALIARCPRCGGRLEAE